MAREALIERNTKETQIRLQLNIDGTGSSDIDTALAFLTICWTVLRAMDCMILR